MKFHSFLIKYGEIGIKGKNRYIFEDALVRQIRFALKDVDGEFYVHKSYGRVYVDCDGEYDYEETVESLARVFGIVGICPVVRLEDKGFEELKKEVVASCITSSRRFTRSSNLSNIFIPPVFLRFYNYNFYSYLPYS